MNLSLLWKKRKVENDSKKADMKLKTKSNPWNSTLKFLQELGKALQYPIAILPFAAILNRFGALGVTYTSTTVDGVVQIQNQAGYWISYIIQTPGNIVFSNLPLIFAIGVAFGLAEDHRGEVALIGGVFYLVLAAFTAKELSLPAMMYGNVLTFHGANGVNYSELLYVKVIGNDGTTILKGTYVLDIGVLGGITAGGLSARLYNKYKTIKLPQALSFFGGRRFVPMLALIVSIPVALLFAIVWPWIQYVLMKFGQAVANPDNPAVAIPGTAVYAIFNRLLLPFGLHQILNTFFWFQLPIHGQVIAPGSGDVINGGTEKWINGDINAFTQGIAGSGLFQSGFFPIMMGGIPAIALAMIYCAKKENRVQVAGFLGGVALVSFISGITEPIEFSFVFISPLLLGIHSVLTGIFMAITTAMHIQIGFGFSAGLIDYCVSLPQSWGFFNHNAGAYHITSNPLWIWLLIALAGVVYFFVFSTLIKKLKIETPGRENDFNNSSFMTFDTGTKEENKNNLNASSNTSASATKLNSKADKYSIMAEKIIAAIGPDNFVSVDNCATRLRLLVKDSSKIDKAKIKAAGAFGIMILTKEAVQIVIGTDVEHVTNEMKKQLNMK